MTEITDLPELLVGDVTDSILLPAYDSTEASNKSRKVTRGNFLNGIARDGGDHDFGTSEITTLVSDDATLTLATIITGLTFNGAATIDTVIAGSLSVATAGTSAGAGETIAVTLTGALTTDHLMTNFTAALPDGLICQSWVSAANTVSFRFFNSTASPIASATYTAKALIVRTS